MGRERLDMRGRGRGREATLERTEEEGRTTKTSAKKEQNFEGEK